MKRSPDEGTHEKPRARYEDALRHQGRAGASLAGGRHVSRRHNERLSERAPERASEPDAEEAEEAPRAGRRGPGREVEASASASDELASARLAASRQRAAQHKMRAATLLMVVPTTIFSVMMIATAQVVLHDWRSYESEASIARAQLGALQEQLGTGQRRLSSLSSPKGREQILAEHGFIRPGDRMLLFPSEPVPQESAARASNDIAARRATRKAAPSSAWDRAAHAMTGWLGHLSGSQSTPQATQAAPQSAPASPDASAGDETASGDAVSPADRIVAPADEGSR